MSALCGSEKKHYCLMELEDIRRVSEVREVMQ